MKIKTLRRIETELDNELLFISRRLQRENNQATKEAAFNAGEASATSAIKKHNRLLGAKFAIRALVSQFNIEKGINDKTAQIAVSEALKTFLENQILSIGQPRYSRNYHSETYEYTVGISDEYEDKIRAEIKSITRKIQSLKDSCNGINAQGDIEISPELMQVFLDYSLVD